MAAATCGDDTDCRYRYRYRYRRSAGTSKSKYRPCYTRIEGESAGSNYSRERERERRAFCLLYTGRCAIALHTSTPLPPGPRSLSSLSACCCFMVLGKSARNPPSPTQKPTPNRPEPGRTMQRLRTAPCPQALRSARDAWRAHGLIGRDRTRHASRAPGGVRRQGGTESYAWPYAPLIIELKHPSDFRQVAFYILIFI